MKILYSLYVFRQAWANSVDQDETQQSRLFAIHPARSGHISRGDNSIIILHENTVFTVCIQTGLGKQCRPRWDTAECCVSSGSTLFAIHPARSVHISRGDNSVKTVLLPSENVSPLKGKNSLPLEKTPSWKALDVHENKQKSQDFCSL